MQARSFGSIETRPATIEDLPLLVADVQAGFDSYAEFAPRGWQAPDVSAGATRMGLHLADASTWALLALADSEVVGHVAVTPAREGRVGDRRIVPPAIPGLGHLWQLFVLPEWWGRNVGARLHELAIAEMHEREFDHARLFTPSLHARARRFYERRRWRATGEQWSEDLGLMLTEYRLSLA